MRGILRSRVDGEGGKDKPQPKHRDEVKDGEPSPPSFRGLDVRNGRIGPAPIPEPVLVSYVDGPDWQVFFSDALNVSGHCCTDLPNFS
jgi:hypothetical protein